MATTEFVTLFTTPTCGWCHRTKDFLRQRGVQFEERDVAADPAAAEELVRRSGLMTVPVTIAGDDVIVGFDRPRLERLAERFRPAGGSAQPPRLGLRVKDAAGGGAEVAAVHPGSPADRAGVQVGDVVEALDGRPVGSAAEMERLARRARATPDRIAVRRGGRRRLLGRAG
jgi:glutaredoxin-like YruB-family protein